MFGIGPPMVVPFSSAGDLELSKLEDLTSWFVDNGVDFLVPCGSAGESELLGLEERTQVIKTVVDSSPDSIPVMAGTGHPGLEETKQQTAQASEVGADAALVVTPFYYSYDESEYREYYEEIARDSDLPIYIYNVPYFTDVSLNTNTIIELSNVGNIAGIKDATGDMTRIRKLVMSANPDFDVFVGAPWIGTAFQIGCSGAITSTINMLPEIANDVKNTHTRQKEQEAIDKSDALIDAHTDIVIPYGTPGMKSFMRKRGVSAGYPRKPHSRVDDLDIDGSSLETLPKQVVTELEHGSADGA